MTKAAKRCIKRAKRLLDAYQNISGERSVAFILAELRHYCDANTPNFHAALDESYDIYLSEKRP